LTEEQQAAITALYEGNVLVYGAMGVGKTVIAASAIAELLDEGELERVLIISTPKIAKTVWKQEFAKWEHTSHITVEIATGNAVERQKVFKGAAQVVVITFNTMADFFRTYKNHNFDGLLIDESTKLKSPGGVGFKSIKRKLKNFTWRAALTGTPTSENFLSLYSQIYLIDDGETFGTSYQKFKETYFYPTDFKQYKWELLPGREKTIADLAAPHIHVVPDYTAELPPISYEEVLVGMPTDVREMYDEMKRHMVVDDVVAVNAAALTMKLQQLAGGWAYDENGETVQINNFKMSVAADLIREIDSPTILLYWFQADLLRLKEQYPNAVELDAKNPEHTVAKWNAGEIDLLLLHPRSAGHGIQLAQGGHSVVWFNPQWSRDLWEQANARVWRRGQTKPVTIYTLVVTDSVDEIVVQRVSDKAKFEKMLLTHLNT
jgi:hypothetical protein